jgi:hypothetical protein
MQEYELLLAKDLLALLLEVRLFWALAGLYLAASVLYLFHILTASQRLVNFAGGMLCITAIAHAGTVLFLYATDRTLPLSTPYELCSLFAFITASAYCITSGFRLFNISGLLVSALSCASILIALLLFNPVTTTLSTMPDWAFNIEMLLTALALGVLSAGVLLEVGRVVAVRFDRGGGGGRHSITAPLIDSMRSSVLDHGRFAYPILTVAVLLGALNSEAAHSTYFKVDSLHAFSSILWLTWTLCSLYTHKSFLLGRKRPSALKKRTRIEPDYTIYLTQEMETAKSTLKKVLGKRLGFRPLKVSDETLPTVAWKKGLWHGLSTIGCLTGALLLLLSLAITYGFAYDGTLALWPGVPEKITFETAWRTTERIQAGFDDKADRTEKETEWSVEVAGVEALYRESKQIEFPEKIADRMAYALGWQEAKFRVERSKELPAEIFADIRILRDRDDGTVAEQNLSLGGEGRVLGRTSSNSLRYAGHTFRVAGLLHLVSLSIDSSPIMLTVETDKEFFIPGSSATFLLTPIISGTLVTVDGNSRTLAPKTELSIDSGQGFGTVGTLSNREFAYFAGRRLSISSYREGVLVEYRYNPGHVLFLLGAIILSLSLFLRYYLFNYLVLYTLCTTRGIVTLQLEIRATGLASSKDRMARRIERILTENDIRPAPLIDKKSSIKDVKPS